MTHTPGPWKLVGDYERDWVIGNDLIRSISTQDGTPVLEPQWTGCYESDPYGDGPSLDVKEEDAWLIAAAPDLLEALQAFMDMPLSFTRTRQEQLDRNVVLDKARVAIAKAKGRSIEEDGQC